jgi:XTP/dITP diphosphohydrolase
MSTRLFLASGNPHKARELQAMAVAFRRAGSGADVEVVSAAEAGGMPDVVEDTGTFLGNCRKKAQALKERLGPEAWVLADDSGLCVDALGGLPGVDSAYYAGPQGDSAANLAKLVDVMRGVTDARRGAQFVCVLVLAGPAGLEKHFEGRCHGRLRHEPAGSGGFGYDPLFVPDGYTLTTAELDPEEKNRISHRGRAWAECVGWLAARG